MGGGGVGVGVGRVRGCLLGILKGLNDDFNLSGGILGLILSFGC